MENFKKSLNKKGQGLRPFILNLAVLIFLVLIIFFIVGNFLGSQNPSSPVLTYGNGFVNNSYSSMNNQLSAFSTTACSNVSGGNCTDNSIFGTLSGSTPSPTDYLFLIFKGAFTIPYTFLTFAFTGIISIANVLYLAFGGGIGGTIIVAGIGLLISGLLVTVVLFIVSAIRSGSSERG